MKKPGRVGVGISARGRGVGRRRPPRCPAAALLGGEVSRSRCELCSTLLSPVPISSGVDLSASDLTMANLRGANLRNATPAGVKFIEADLTGASLVRAVMYQSDLTEAKLRGADLSHASVSVFGAVPSDPTTTVSL